MNLKVLPSARPVNSEVSRDVPYHCSECIFEQITFILITLQLQKFSNSKY